MDGTFDFDLRGRRQPLTNQLRHIPCIVFFDVDACEKACIPDTHRTARAETEIEALGQQARDLAVSVETVRKETRLRSETEIAALGQQARALAISVESVREETLFQPGDDLIAFGVRQHTHFGKHCGMGNRAVNIVMVKTIIKADGGSKTLDKGISRFRKAAAPRFNGLIVLAHVGYSADLIK